MLKPTIHVDEFASKMGDDDEIIVISFFVRDEQAAIDLTDWFEKGYDFVLDADRSPGEIRPNRYLVYIELRRRSAAGIQVARLIDDLETLTEHSPDDWTIHYEDKVVPFSREMFEKIVPMTPDKYRERIDRDLNEVRTAAGVAPKKIYEVTPDLRSLQDSAGIPRTRR